MIKIYTEEEICSFYRRASEKQDKIKLLQELTLKSKFEIVEILNKHGYKASAKKGKNTKFREAKFLHFYELGWNDVKIAKVFNVNANTVGYWRGKYNLPANYRNKKSLQEQANEK